MLSESIGGITVNFETLVTSLVVVLTGVSFADAIWSRQRRNARRRALLQDRNEISDLMATAFRSRDGATASNGGSSAHAGPQTAESSSAGEDRGESPHNHDVVNRPAEEFRVLEERLALAEQRIQQFDATVPFEKEASNAKWSSRIAFWVGFLVVAIVIFFGIEDWRNASGLDQLSTGAGIARTGVLASAFYLAGQLFKRSTRLYLKAADLERAAIALRHVSALGDDLPDGLRNALVFSVFRQHLTGSYEPDDTGSDENWVELLDRLKN